MRFAYTAPSAHEDAGPAPTVTIDLEGFHDDDHIARIIRERQTFYEEDLLEHIARRGPRGGVYIDVGANIGNHSVYFGKFLADHVIAIEPAVELLPILKRNLEANGIQRYSVLACAVGASAGTGCVVLPQGFEGNVGASRIQVDCGTDVRRPANRIRIETLDSLLCDLASCLEGMPIAFVKMDVEGMELDTLRGATDLLRNHRPQLAIELATPEVRRAVTSFLAVYHYESVGQFCSTPTYHFIDPERHTLRANNVYSSDEHARAVAEGVRQTREFVQRGESLILVDEGQWGTEPIEGCQVVPFMERDGQYWGPPPDDTTAIAEFERLRQSGASFMVFAWPAFWWLEHYAGLNRYLRTKFRCLLENERLVVFDLRINPVVSLRSTTG